MVHSHFCRLLVVGLYEDSNSETIYFCSEIVATTVSYSRAGGNALELKPKVTLADKLLTSIGANIPKIH